MSGGILGSIEKLKGSENYITWKIAVENLLCYEALDEFITKAELASGDAPKDKKAKSIITLTLDKSILIHIASCKTAKEVWDALKTTYEDLGLTRKLSLVQKITNTKLESSNSMESYVSDIMTAAHSLDELGFKIPDDFLAMFLLAGLTPNFEPMIIAMESTATKLKSEDVKTKLLQERNSAVDGNAFWSRNNFKKQTKSNLTCYSCKKSGHKSAQCPEKDDSNKQQKSNAAASFSAAFLSGSFNKDDWYVDSGATQHMTMHRDWINQSKSPFLKEITAADGEAMQVACSGTTKLMVDNGNNTIANIDIYNVLCVPKLAANLL